MTTHQLILAKPSVTAPPSFAPVRGGLLQRKCACGGTPGPSGECAECEKKRMNLQRKANDQNALGAGVSVSRLPVMQRKLTIGASNDPLEQEADRIADQVLAAPANPAVSGAPPHIQRFTGQASAPTGTAAPASVDRVLASPGSPLGPALRQDMEQRFGHDFSRVRVHSGAASDKSARDVNAHAYTAGQDIVFGAGQFAPGTLEGRRLLAHELTHVVQQGAASRVDNRAKRSTAPRLRSGSGLQRQPASNTCPSTITTDTTLTRNCSNGITVNANNVTLDCGGHTLSGQGRGTPVLLRGRTGVTVKNCNIDNFNEGVTLHGSSGNTFTDNTVNNNIRDGFDLNNSPGNTFSTNNIGNNRLNGIELDDSNENIVRLNDVHNNGENISLDRSNSNKFALNNVHHSNQAGFHLDQNSSMNTFFCTFRIVSHPLHP